MQELRSEALRAALRAGLAGQTRELEDLLARHGGLPGRPNLKLAAAFGAAVADEARGVAALLDRFTNEDAAPNHPRAYLPIAAAHGWMARIEAGRDVEAGWTALQLLAADERTPVRLGTRQALQDAAVRGGDADTLVARAVSWLEGDADRELALGSAALVIDTLGDPQLQAVVRDREALLVFLAAVIDRVANASRAAARSEGRRRILASLPSTLARVAASSRGFEWLSALCEETSHPDLRAVLSKTLLELADDARSAQLRKALEASAKPLRDAARVRPGHGRGRRSRSVR